MPHSKPVFHQLVMYPAEDKTTWVLIYSYQAVCVMFNSRLLACTTYNLLPKVLSHHLSMNPMHFPFGCDIVYLIFQQHLYCRNLLSPHRFGLWWLQNSDCSWNPEISLHGMCKRTRRFEVHIRGCAVGASLLLKQRAATFITKGKSLIYSKREDFTR